MESAAWDLEGSIAIADPPPVAEPWWFRVRVTEQLPSGKTEVTVRPDLDRFDGVGAPGVEGTLRADGTALVDIGPALASLSRRSNGEVARRVLVALHHDDLLDAPTEHRLPDPLPASITNQDRAFEVEVAARPIRWIRGRFVHSETGAPITAGMAALYPISGGVPVRSAIDSVDLQDGTFELRGPDRGQVAVLGLQSGMRPSTALVDVGVATGVTLLGDVGMSPGYTITGFLEAAQDRRPYSSDPDEPLEVGAGFDVTAAVTEITSFIELPGFGFRSGFSCAGLVWRVGAFEWLSWTTDTLPGARFEISGLAPSDYSVNWSDPGVNRPFPSSNQETVTAPASIRLQGLEARVEIRLNWAGHQPDGHPVIVGTYAATQGTQRREVPFSALERDDDHGSRADLVFQVPPGQGTTIALEVDGFQPAERSVPALAAGDTITVDVLLEPTSSGGSLIFELCGAAVPDGSTLSILRRGAREEEFQLTVEGGVSVSDAQPPGQATYEIVVGEDRFATVGHFCRATVDVDVPPAGERRVPVNITLGGTLVVEIKDRAGGRYEGLVELTDIDGVPIPSIWVANIDRGRVASLGAVTGSGPARRASELPPGTYGIRMISGDRPTERQTFDITAGRTTEVLIELADR